MRKMPTGRSNLPRSPADASSGCRWAGVYDNLRYRNLAVQEIPLRKDLPVAAILVDRQHRLLHGLEQVAVLGINRNPLGIGLEWTACQFELVRGLLDEIRRDRRIIQRGINPTLFEDQDSLQVRWIDVLFDRAALADATVCLVDSVFLRALHLDRDILAAEVGQAADAGRVALTYQDRLARSEVGNQRHLALEVRRDLQCGDDRITLLGQQGTNDLGRIGLLDGGGEAHLRRDRLGNVDIEADGLLGRGIHRLLR